MQAKKFQKINSLIRKSLNCAINNILSEEFGVICVNMVLVNDDLGKAQVYISSLNHQERLLRRLNQKKYEINKEFIKLVKLRRTPRLEFVYDEKLEQIIKVENILESLNSKK